MAKSPAQTGGAAVQVEAVVDGGPEDVQHGRGDDSLQVGPAVSRHIDQPPHLDQNSLYHVLPHINLSLTFSPSSI